MTRLLFGWAVPLGFLWACAGSGYPAKGADASPDLGRDYVVEGRFGTALDAAYCDAEASRALPAYKSFPLTVELWCKLNSHALFNILVVNEPKESADHWEMYTEFGTGTLSAYFPGLNPSIIKSSLVVADQQWHYVAMVVDKNRVVLYADGKEVARATVAKQAGGTVIPGKLSIGATASLGCDGAIDDLRISNVAREIRGVPHAPQTADDHTIGLWNFDYVAGAKAFADASPNANPIGQIQHISLSARSPKLQGRTIAAGFPGRNNCLAGGNHRSAG